MVDIKNIAVFIDADNLNDPTALDHVLTEVRTRGDRVLYRRAYGRTESLKGVEPVLWRHGVRPVANLIVDKVTTDGALLIDAVEAVCTNDIDLVAICSGDADFVPLAIWLREKGCRVICFSLSNKIFANPESFYDEVVLLDVVESPTSLVSKVSPKLIGAGDSPVSSVVQGGAKQSSSQASKTKATQKTAPKGQASPATTASVKSILKVLPELKNGQFMHLSVVTQKLREVGLLGKSASSPVLFRRFAAQFELTPKAQPNQVRFRG